VLNRLFNDDDVSTLPTVELGVLGPLQVWLGGTPITIPGAKPRAILAMLGLRCGSVVAAETLIELLWGDEPPRTAAKALQTHISSLRHTLGDGLVLTQGTGWIVNTTQIDASHYKLAASMGRAAIAAGDTTGAVARFEAALALWRGIPELPDTQRGQSEKTRWLEGHAALLEDRADALLATGRAAEVIGELEAAVAEAPLRERRWGQLMLALYRAGRQGEALGAYQRARSLLADELGVDPGPHLRRLEAAIVAQDTALEMPASQQLSAVTRAVTFLLTDIEGSTAAWEADADAMAAALARHDEIVEQVVTSRGGRLIKTRGEGDATFSVFDRPSAAAAAAIELQDAIHHEPWTLVDPMRIRVALHTGEVELRDGDYFGRAVNRAARLRSLAAGGQILCSGATAELVIDSLADDVVLADLGMRQLKNLARPEHVFELRLETADDSHTPTTGTPIERPVLPAVLAGPGPFVGRGHELGCLLSAWQTTLAAGTRAVLIAGEPGVGKTRLAGEWSGQAYEQGAVVLYGRCDEDLGAPYQPFAEALRSLAPCLGASRMRGLRGVEALLALIPGLSEVVPDITAPPRADADTERYALFDAVVALLGIASANAPVVLVLDDLHWAAKPTLLLLRHLLRFGDQARVQVVGTYRSTDLDRSHPLAATLADLHRDGCDNRLQLRGLDEDDVSAYVAEAGYDDEELARALASVTGGNPFFLIEALRHVDESGGRWDPSTLPQGVREAVSRRLSRLPEETNKALAAAAVVGSRFALDLVERVVGDDLVDAFDEACQAGIVIEEPGGRYRFNHAIVRQSLLAELASVRRMRLHQRIAATLEAEPGADDERLAELAYHYSECAWAGNAAKAVEYCRRAADQAMSRLAYEGAADLYDHALHALEELDEELPDRDDQVAELLVARCEALLAGGDVASAAGAVAQLQEAAGDSARLAAWGTCFNGQLSMLTDPERLDEIESAVGAAAAELAGLDDAAGEAKAHTVRATCLARLGRIGDCEMALDHALTAARRARDHRRVNAVLAGAPLAALWGPNPVPRAGGRCLDVVRLLRITTGSPVVEATSTRCQGVLDAFRGRAAAGRQLIDSARRSLTDLGMRHALLEVDQFAGIIELVADDPAAAEAHLRRAYNGFRRMGLDSDTAESAALLARACLALDRDAEADELCTESERLAGHALKASMTWRTVRAQLLARSGAYDAARQVAEEAVAMAAGTDALVDHGDASLALATVLGTVGDVTGAKAAAEQAVSLYERKGAAALAEKARKLLGTTNVPASVSAESPIAEPNTACVRVGRRVAAAIDRGAWEEYGQLFAPEVFVESRRKIVGFSQIDLQSGEWPHEARRIIEAVPSRVNHVVIAVRGEHLALTRLVIATADMSPGAPRDEFLQLYGIDKKGRIALQVFFDVEDIDAALAELDAVYARFEEEHRSPRAALENAASQVDQRLWRYFPARNWDAMAEILSDDFSLDDRRQAVNAGVRQGRDTEIENLKAMADLAGSGNLTCNTIATRGDRLALRRLRFSEQERQRDAFYNEMVGVVEINADNRLSSHVVFDDLDAAFAELDARYLAGEAASYAGVWQSAIDVLGEANRHEPGPILTGLTYVDHRRISFGSGDFAQAVEELWPLVPDARYRLTAVHALDVHGIVASLVIEGTDSHGYDLQWSRIALLVPDEPRMEVFEDDDLDTALATFEQLSRPARRMENAASQVAELFLAKFAACNWDAMAELLTDDFSNDDRRRVVGASTQHGRDASIDDMRAIADLWTTTVSSTVIATRGERLALMRFGFADSDQGSEAFISDIFGVAQITTDERVAAFVAFDLEDLEGALAELDTRYIAGEAAARSRTWSVITGGNAALNRHELPPATPNCATVDHRRGAAFAPGELIAYVRAGWDLDQNVRTYIEVVHRLSDLGAVYTHAAHGVSQDGFDAEWRGLTLLTVEGNLVNRVEVFDEADIDAALARFDELSRQAPRLENVASQVAQRYWMHFAAGDLAGIADTLARDLSVDDRRRVVNAGIRHGRDTHIEDVRAATDVGFTNVTSAVIATRGTHLALTRARYSSRNQRPEAFQTEVLHVGEIDAEEKFASVVVFDLDDLDAAFEELDARYLAGEAAACADMWSAITQAYVAANRHELPASTPGWVNIDHRRARAFAPGEMTDYMNATWDLAPDVRTYIEAVHELSDTGAVLTHAAYGTSYEGFDAEWRETVLVAFEGDLLSRSELFDEGDIDAALARFDELSRPTLRLENTASQVTDRFLERFATRDWEAMAQMVINDISFDDRRRVVNADLQIGRDLFIENFRTAADLGATQTVNAIATRGERLVLTRARFARRGGAPGEFGLDLLHVIEIDTDNRVVATVTFDPDDIDAAFEELDARYVAGEASAYTHLWSVIAGAYAALNRREIGATAPDWVTVDHRRLTPSAGDLTADARATWDLAPNVTWYVEAVHSLGNLGAVVTHAASGTSKEGFDAEWRGIDLVTVEGDVVKRAEVFDEADLDVALARFDELQRPAPRLESAASRVYERQKECYAAGDWDAMGLTLSDDVLHDDRRRVVNSGLRRGREAEIAEIAGIADGGMTHWTSAILATRGDRIVLNRARVSSGQGPEAFYADVLDVVEIDADERVAARVVFDPDDVDAAFKELDTRYLADEAAAHANTWSLITQAYDSLNRRELAPTTPDFVNIDHRRGTSFASGDMPELLKAVWDLATDLTNSIVAVHRLNDRGAVVTHAAHEASHDGFVAEWRVITVVTVKGDMIDRCEVFDEADLEAALDCFEGLSRPAPQLENAASQVAERLWSYFALRDWDAIAEILTDDISTDDHRRVVNGGLRRGKDAALVPDLRVGAAMGATHITPSNIATRGERLALSRTRYWGPDQRPEAFVIDVLTITEIDSDERIAALVTFDPDDIDAAFEELDARYIAGEAAAFARTWSVIAQIFATLKGHELPPTTPDWMDIDHRRGGAFAPGDMTENIRATWEQTPDIGVYVQAVHRLTNCGAVVTGAANGTSLEGFAAEWRQIDLVIIEGDRINRCEVFDEADIDAALARFEELQPQTPRLKNAASQVYEGFWISYEARDWGAIAEMLADDISTDDRRRVVNAGIQRGRDGQLADIRSLADIGANITWSVVATRGQRLVLSRLASTNRDLQRGEFGAEMLSIIEIDSDYRIVAGVLLDTDDIDAAFEELETRYLAGEAAAHAHTWSLTTQAYAAFNRRELPATTPDWVNTDNRRGTAFASGEVFPYVQSAWDVAPNINIYIEAVHRLSHFGSVVIYAAHGTSGEGFDAEWREITLLTFEGGLISRCEIFDEEDLDAALARFDELNSTAPQVKNAAIRARARLVDASNRRDMDGILALAAADGRYEDRRKMLRDEGPTTPKFVRAWLDATTGMLLETAPVAIRGPHLGLTRDTYRDVVDANQPIASENLTLTEVSGDGLVRNSVFFDPEDINGAFAELTAGWIASGEVAHPDVIEAGRQLNEAYNRHDWDEVAALEADAVYVNHRQLASGDAETIADHWLSIRTTASLIPDMWVEVPEIITHSAAGLVMHVVVKGTTTQGVAIELPALIVQLFDGYRLKRLEALDLHQRDLALARFDELNAPSH
jgi:class 3 adenylate cyclase